MGGFGLPSLSLAVHMAHIIPELVVFELAAIAKLMPSPETMVYSNTVALTRS